MNQWWMLIVLFKAVDVFFFLFYSKLPFLEIKYDCLNLKFWLLLEWTPRRRFTLGCVLLRVTWRRRPIRNPTASVISPVIVDQAMMSLPVHLSLMVSVHWSNYLGLSRNEAGFFPCLLNSLVLVRCHDEAY